MKNKNSFSPRNYGISLLMVLFIVLCFAVFAMLSLSSARNNLDSSRQFADRKTAYYNACNEAEEIISERMESGFSGTEDFTIEISETQQLRVVVSISGDTYDIQKWQTEARE